MGNHFINMYYCSLCNKEYPKNVSKCVLDHCKFCGDTSLEVSSRKITNDSIFIIINTLFALLIVNGLLNTTFEYSLVSIIIGAIVYIIGMSTYLYYVDRKTRYYCKNCKTVLNAILTDVVVGEYEQKPEVKEIIQGTQSKKSHLKEIIMILGSLGSVISVIIILLPRT